MDYSHLGKHLKSPKFVLPSIYQLIRNKFIHFNNLFYIKIDLKAAFFNIPLKESSRYVTTFIYNSVHYQMTKLPMGLSLSPFVMQKFSNAIIAKYKEACTFTTSSSTLRTTRVSNKPRIQYFAKTRRRNKVI